MPLDQQEATKLAIKDLSKRLAVAEEDITLLGVEKAQFPDACLGATLAGEMAAQMLTSGWRLQLRHQNGTTDQDYEYRASKNQLRLVNFHGKNYKVYP